MPSERSMPSEITGEKAARTKARSISLQTWIRPFWMTVRVTGSRFDAGSDIGPCLSQKPHRSNEVSLPGSWPAAAHLFYRGASRRPCVELLQVGLDVWRKGRMVDQPIEMTRRPRERFTPLLVQDR